jgi:hypothetical protein
MLWIKKLNFMETAKLEMELMKAFEAGEDLDQKLQEQADVAKQSNDPEQSWKLDVWTKMLVRIRKMETLMRDQTQPKP